MLKKAYNTIPFNVRFFLLHFLFWLLVLFLPMGDYIMGHTDFPTGFLIKTAFCIGIFYFNYFILVPKLLLKHKQLLYIICALAIIIGFTIIFAVFLKQWDGPMRFKGMKDMPKPPMARMHDNFRFFPNVIMLTLHLSFSAMFKIYVEWNNTFKRQKEAETEKKISELNFLKAQLNPHFFFNSLNTIFSLAIQKSDKTSVAVLNLSDLMRYMLYETDKEKVLLQEEILYIENYIELQKLRLTSNNKITFTVEGNPAGILIPPLLFICFVENSFKHGINPATDNEIIVKFTILHNELRMFVVNDINKQAKVDESSGLGIDNTVKRIELYYPGKNTLNTYIENDKFYVELTLKLSEN